RSEHRAGRAKKLTPPPARLSPCPQAVGGRRIHQKVARILLHSPRGNESMSNRALEPGIVTDLATQLTYGRALRLDRLLDAQQPRSGGPGTPPRHDEMLFIIQHQASEFWMKLLIHDTKAV